MAKFQPLFSHFFPAPGRSSSSSRPGLGTDRRTDGMLAVGCGRLGGRRAKGKARGLERRCLWNMGT